jgi:hypothetical protein
LSEKKPQDFGEEEDKLNPISKEKWHPEKARISLAYWVLGAIFVMFILSIVTDILVVDGKLDRFVSQELFEICRTGLLPIVTLILGYYFSKNN